MPARHETECGLSGEAAACVCGELSREDEALFLAHTETCETCRRIVAEFNGVLTHLKTDRDDVPGEDLSARILAQLPDELWREARSGSERKQRFVLFPVLCRVAAVAVIIMSAFTLWQRSRRGGVPGRNRAGRSAAAVDKTDAVRGALEWLLAAQEPDGSWDPVRWGGKDQYKLSLTGMAMLSFLRPAGQPIDAAHLQAVRRACGYVLRNQADSGRIGSGGDGMMYNHGMATVALLEAYHVTRDADLKPGIAAAVGFIANQQHSSGGWGYRPGPADRANTGISVWQLHALLLARRQGLGVAPGSLQRGLRWLRGVVDDRGDFGYHQARDVPGASDTLTAMGAFCLFTAAREMQGLDAAGTLAGEALRRKLAARPEQVDFYRWYFTASALGCGDDPSYGTMLTELQDSVARKLARSGPDAGSWDPVGRWGSVGGRLYSTCMATLSLQQTPRG
jgi:hypothetical protein